MSSLRKVYKIRIATKTIIPISNGIKGTQSNNNMLYTLSESLCLGDLVAELDFSKWAHKIESCTKYMIFLIVLILSLQVAAQEKWTLEKCIAYGIKNNLQLMDAGINEKLAGLNYLQSKWNLLPGVNAGVGAGMNYGRSVDPNTNGFVNTSFFNNSYYLGSSVDLFNGFILQNQIRYQKFRKEAAENSKLNVQDDLAFEVMSAFFNVVYYKELLTIANEQKALSEMIVKKLQILVSTGLKAQTDLLEVMANFEKDELLIIQTSNMIASSMIGLKKAMNLNPDQQIELAIPEKEQIEVAEIVSDIPLLYTQHIGWSPSIRLFDSELQASRKIIAISKGGFFPSISLQAGYNTGFYETNKVDNQTIAFNRQIRNNRSQYVGASLNIPLFSRNAVRFDVQRARLSFEQSQAKLELAKQTVRYEIEETYNELTASWKELQQSEKQMQADTLAFQAAQKKYDQGMINAVELYTTKNRMANTASLVLHSKLTYEMKKRMLGFYKGERFWEEEEEKGRRGESEKVRK